MHDPSGLVSLPLPHCYYFDLPFLSGGLLPAALATLTLHHTTVAETIEYAVFQLLDMPDIARLLSVFLLENSDCIVSTAQKLRTPTPCMIHSKQRS